MTLEHKAINPNHVQTKYLIKFVLFTSDVKKKKYFEIRKKQHRKKNKIKILFFIRCKPKALFLSLWKIKLVLWTRMTMNCRKYHVLYNIVLYMFVI